MGAVGGVTRGLSRLVRGLIYAFTFGLVRIGDDIWKNPGVVSAAYDDVISEKIKRIKMYRDAVASRMMIEETKKAKVKHLTDEAGRLENLKAGALARARQIVEKLKAENKTEEEIKGNEEYKTCLAAFNDFSSTLKEKQERIAELQGDLKELAQKIGDHKVQLRDLMRELDKIRDEKPEAVAEMISSREEREVADMLSGLEEDGTAADLAKLRETRVKVRAEARIASEMAGTDTRAQEAQFIQYARESVASGEFESLVGLSSGTVAEAPAPAAADKLPE